MDLNVNAINFQGKKEVLYGLKKAAQLSKDYEYYNQPLIASRRGISLQTFQNEKDASIKAYLDMVLRDEAFEKTIQEIKASELYDLHSYLQPEKTQYSLVMPMNKFREAVQETLNSIGRIRNMDIRKSVEKLFKDLEL